VQTSIQFSLSLLKRDEWRLFSCQTSELLEQTKRNKISNDKNTPVSYNSLYLKKGLVYMKAFRESIINIIYMGATSTKKIRILLTPLVGFIFFCIISLLILGSFFLDRFFGFEEFISKPLEITISMPLLISGSCLWLWCAGKFFKAKGTPVPINPPPKLVTDGPYAYSRNPMMTGLFMVMAGIGVLFGSVTLTFLITPLFVFMSILEFKYIEEPELVKRFGKNYTDYKEKTPIIIPWIR
jgi:protein-S-isoprenylcysteine O-methyltransferase Ste14